MAASGHASDPGALGVLVHRPLRSVAMAIVLAASALSIAAPTAAHHSEYHAVRSIARAQVGDPWISRAVGPDAFDCSGLVYYVFRRAGLLDRIGGTRRSAAGYWDWFAARGKTSRTNGRRGDLVIWNRGTHIGIYLGDGRAISTLTRGVTVHGIHALAFTTFLKVRLTR